MNCQSFESIVNDLAREQIVEATVRDQALIHTANCQMCSARLREEYNLTKDLRQLSAGVQAATTPDKVEARLITEFRSHHGAKNVAGGRVSQSPAVVGLSQNNRRYWNYAAAAGILIAVALGITANRFWRSEFSAGVVGSGKIAPLVDLGANTSVPADSPARDFPLPPETPIKRAAPGNTRRPANQSSASRFRVAKNTVTVQSLDIMVPDLEVTTDFIPIAYSNASNIQEGGQVVRLELPRYAMARFGVPINEERYGERVKADVWVGADGLARAIRFVQ